MHKVAEYGSAAVKNGPQSTERLIKKGVHRLNGVEVSLVDISEGWACAGSMARYDSASFAVRFTMKDGSRHGRRFPSTPTGLDNAEKEFERITK